MGKKREDVTIPENALRWETRRPPQMSKAIPPGYKRKQIGRKKSRLGQASSREVKEAFSEGNSLKTTEAGWESNSKTYRDGA